MRKSEENCLDLAMRVLCTKFPEIPRDFPQILTNSQFSSPKCSQFATKKDLEVRVDITETHILTVEVGCRGFVSPFLHRSFKNLGFSDKEIDELRDKCSYIARLSRLGIWLSRFSRDFRAECLVDIDMEAFKRIAQV